MAEHFCLKCGYKWIGKKDTPPIRCANPLCKSAHWSRPRRALCACKRRSINTSYGQCSLCRQEALRSRKEKL